jgi:hypothetical protein
MVPLDRGGAHVPVQLRGGLRSPNMTITHAGSTQTILMAGSASSIDNHSNTS